MATKCLFPGAIELLPSSADLTVLNNYTHNLHPWLSDMAQLEQYKNMEAIGKNMANEGLLPELSDTLSEVATHDNHALLSIGGIWPHDLDIGKTPTEYRTPENNYLSNAEIQRGLMLGMMGVYSYGYISQQPFNIRNDIIAIDSLKETNGVSASIRQLDLHTEDASYNLTGAVDITGSVPSDDLDMCPDWLTLSFLRNPDNIPTFVSIPNLDDLDPTIRKYLEMPYYRNLTNPGQGGSANDADCNVSVIYEHKSVKSAFRINTSNIVVAPDAPLKAEFALNAIKEYLYDNACDLPVTPGTTVFVDNRRALHGRRPYSAKNLPKYDGKDRWQQRVVATDDLDRISPFEVTERIVDPLLLIKMAARHRLDIVK